MRWKEVAVDGVADRQASEVGRSRRGNNDDDDGDDVEEDSRWRKKDGERWRTSLRRLEKEAEQEPGGEIGSQFSGQRGEKERDDRSADRK